MTTLKLKHLLIIAWLAIALVFASGIIPTQQFGFTAVPEVHACIVGNSGGGC